MDSDAEHARIPAIIAIAIIILPIRYPGSVYGISASLSKNLSAYALFDLDLRRNYSTDSLKSKAKSRPEVEEIQMVESECPDSNRGPLRPERSALPTEPHSEIYIFEF